MYPRNDCKISFKYPLDHLLLHGMISEELISKPEALDSTGDRCILVIKNGTSTGVTIGRATGIQSFVRDDDTGEVSREWAIYNYDSKSGVFSAPGDSGSILVALDALVGCFMVVLARQIHATSPISLPCGGSCLESRHSFLMPTSTPPLSLPRYDRDMVGLPHSLVLSNCFLPRSLVYYLLPHLT